MAMVRLAVRREQQRQEWRSAMLLQSPVFPAVITVSDCAQTDRNSTTVIANMSSACLLSSLSLTNIREKIWKFYFLLSPVSPQYFVAKTNLCLERNKCK